MELFSPHRDKGYSNPTLCGAKDGAPRLEMPQNHHSGSALPARYSWESYSLVSSPFFLLTRPPLNFSILLRSARVAFGWPIAFRAACFTNFAAFRGFFFAISGPFPRNIPAPGGAYIPFDRDVCGASNRTHRSRHAGMYWAPVGVQSIGPAGWTSAILDHAARPSDSSTLH